jgi:hypothetical protein
MNDDTAVLAPVPAAREDDDSLAAELAKAAPRRWWNSGTVLLAGLLLLVGGFAAGLQVQKSYGAETPTAAGNRPAGGRGFPGALASAAPAAPAATTGTVKLVNGTTLYLETAAGEVLTVKTDGRTSVSTARAAELADVKAGQSVTVQGATGADGTVTATSVTARAK